MVETICDPLRSFKVSLPLTQFQDYVNWLWSVNVHISLINFTSVVWELTHCAFQYAINAQPLNSGAGGTKQTENRRWGNVVPPHSLLLWPLITDRAYSIDSHHRAAAAAAAAVMHRCEWWMMTVESSLFHCRRSTHVHCSRSPCERNIASTLSHTCQTRIRAFAFALTELSPQQSRRYSPNFSRFPYLPHSPFSSHSHSLHSPPAAKEPLKTSYGVWGSASGGAL